MITFVPFTLGPIIRQYLVVITVNLSILSAGLALAWPSPVLVKLRNETETVLPRAISEEEGSWIVSIGFLFSIVAYVISIFLVDRIGRKMCILIAYAPKLISGFVFIFAGEVWHFYIGRIFNSLADSIFFAVVPIYASEIASTELRGSIGTILQIMCSIGMLLMYSMGPFISLSNLNVTYTCLIFVSYLPIMLIPDSPYYLYTKGKSEETVKLLVFFRGSENIAKEEMKEYDVQKQASEISISRIELMKNRTFMKSVFLTLTLAATVQLVGFDAVAFYLQTILESTKTSISPETSSVIVGLIQLIASLCTASITYRFGCKPILLSTVGGLALGMVGLGTFFYLKEAGKEITGFLNFLPLLSLIAIVFCFSGGFGSLVWPLIAELFDGPTRGIGVLAASAFHCIFMFSATRYFPLLIATIGPAATYIIFTANCILTIVFITFCIPETKGKTFSEIQEALGGKIRKNDIE